MVQVDLAIIFRITDASKFVYDLGALKFDELLAAATEESIRGLVRGTPHDRIYELRGSKASKFLGELNKKFDKFGVTFSDATITAVSLPAELAQTLEKETTFDSKQKEEEKSHQYQLKVLNDEADLKMKQLKAKNERFAQDEMAKKERALIQKGQREIEAQRQKQLAIIKAEEDASVMKYKAETEVINSRIKCEKEASLMILQAEGEAQAAKIKADQEAATEETRSKAEVIAAENRAKALIVEAEAEAKAASQLKDKRAHDLALNRMKGKSKIQFYLMYI
jgi:regulator of protease activity HflC (stomatin/prohibitin superfamily)